MKQQKMIAKQIQKGVKFYYKEVPDLYHDKKTAYDIDVDDNVKELIIATDLKMNNTKKSFPSVKKLIIDALVVDIQIPNSLFPNVKNTKKCILKACCRPVFSFFLPCKIRHIKYETRYKNKERKREK